MRGERVKVGKSCTLARERGGSEREHGVERVDSMVNKGRFQEGKGGQARRGGRNHERMSGSKSSPGRSAESWFHSKSGQT